MNRFAVFVLGLLVGSAYAQPTPSSSPQVATPASSTLVASQTEPASGVQSASTPETASAPANPHDPNAPTLAQLQAPTESELSVANTELLAKNAELEGRVAELTTQINLLVNERHAQFFLYGALSALFCFSLGAALSWLIFNKKKSSW